MEAHDHKVMEVSTETDMWKVKQMKLPNTEKNLKVIQKIR